LKTNDKCREDINRLNFYDEGLRALISGAIPPSKNPADSGSPGNIKMVDILYINISGKHEISLSIMSALIKTEQA